MVVRTVLATVVGMAVIAFLAGDQGGLAMETALLGGSGLGWAFAFSRVRRGPLALPPLLSIVGVAIFALACVAAVRPAAFYVPRWILPLPAVDVAVDRVLGRDDQQPAVVVAAHARYRRAFARLLAPDDASALDACPVDVILVDDAGYALLAGAAAKEEAQLGFAHAPALGRSVVVHRAGSGWGSITHHLAGLWTPCALPNAPRWLVEGVAALVEKHRLVDDDAGTRFDLHFRSDWRVPESLLASPPRDLQLELSTARDQGFLRAFFLFLAERGHLAPLMERVRNDVAATQALADVTKKGPKALEAEWRQWLHEEASRIPTLDAATPDVTTPPI